MSPKAPSPPGLEELLAAREIVVTCGPGGVGKTTTAAALAAAAAVLTPARILVVTVDPARRLADALGIGPLGDEPSAVPAEALASAGAKPKGELFAAMLDAQRSWDGLVARYAPSRATADAILTNPLYRNITGRFSRSHEYIAMERLYELHAKGEFDLIVVDTPPTRNALDFLDAPSRMADFFTSGLLHWLIAPYRSRFVSLASRPFTQIADRVLGTEFLADLAQFFSLLSTMSSGFVERANAVADLVCGPKTTFAVVTTLESVPVTETERFVDALAERRLHLGLLIANKVLPDTLRHPGAARVAERFVGRGEELAGVLAEGPLGNFEQVRIRGVLEEIGRSFLDFRLIANRESELFSELSTRHELAVRVPHLAGEVNDVAGLLEIGGLLFGRPLRRRRSPSRSPRDRPLP